MRCIHPPAQVAQEDGDNAWKTRAPGYLSYSCTLGQGVSICKVQVAPEGGEEVDKRALLDRLKCSGLGTAVTSPEDRSNVDYMVKNRVCTVLPPLFSISFCKGGLGQAHLPQRCVQPA